MEAIFLLGSAQAFFLAILVFSKAKKVSADYVLGSWLIIMGLHVLYYYFNSTGILDKYPHLLGTGVAFPLLEPALMLIYVLTATNKEGLFKTTFLLHLSPWVIFTIWFSFEFFFLPGQDKLAYFQQIRSGNVPMDLRIMTFPNILMSPIYIVWSLIKLKQHSKHISQDFSFRENINLEWLSYVISAMGIISVTVIVSNIMVLFPSMSHIAHDNIIYITGVFAIFFIGFFGIKQQAIYTASPLVLKKDGSLESQEIQVKPEKQYLHSGLKPEDASKYLEDLLEYFENEKPYLNGKLSLGEVADHLCISVNNLSQVINEKTGKTFFDFVNSYRIEEVKSKIDKDFHKNFTLLGIAFESGFNSKSSFNSIFKKSTGLTPSQYAMNLQTA